MTPELLRELREALNLGEIEYDEYEMRNGTGTVVYRFRYPKGKVLQGGANTPEEKRLVEVYEAMTKSIQDEHSASAVVPTKLERGPDAP